jgi:arginyl-tRNA--protein-N-Asp/Glu arginylyltransferase
MLVLQQFVADDQRCAYLPDRASRLEYTYAASLSPAEYEALMNRGYRKFGALLFRPVCSACDECRPVRVSLEEFRPDQSQRRALKRNGDLVVRVGRPRCDSARLDLYERYHRAQAERKGWPDGHKDARDYAFSFVQNPLPAAEISAWEGDTLRAVSLVDLTPNVASAVYHYYDPAQRERSLGTFVLLETFRVARELQKRWVYLGYHVAGCASMAYKARFRPCEVLDAGGEWRPLAGVRASEAAAATPDAPAR